MSAILWAAVALAVIILVFVLLVTLGLARAATHSDQVERGAVQRWIARRRRPRRAA
jgi:fumarate reductase subunit D